MTTAQWEQFKHTASKAEFEKAYLEFMYSKENAYNCKNCPMNDEFDDWQNQLPCGQWSCWVTSHCHRN